MLQRLFQYPIRIRLPAFIVLALSASLGAMVFLFQLYVSQELQKKNDLMTSSIARQTVEDTQAWVARQREALRDLAEDRSSRDLLLRLGRILGASGTDLRAIHAGYVTQNPSPLGERVQLDAAGRVGAYDEVHQQFHPHFRRLLERRDFHDLFFMLPNGDVVYSVTKKADFATNLVDGPFARTGLGTAFEAAMDGDATATAFLDFAPYAPSADAPASFMARAVVDGDGRTIGVVAIQLPIGALAAQIAATRILVPEGEVYLVGADGRARTPSKDPGLLSVLDPVPRLEHIAQAGPGHEVLTQASAGLAGRAVYAAVESFDVFGTTWHAVVERDRQAADAGLADFRRMSIVALIVGVAVSLAIGILAARSVTGPLQRLAEDMQRLADGDHDPPIDGVNRQDELGHLSEILDSVRVKLRGAERAAEREAERGGQQARVVQAVGGGLKQLAAGDLTARLDDPFVPEHEELRQDFNATLDTMSDLMRTIVENANEIHARAEEISTSSDDLSHRTENQAATLEETAAALDELTASVREAAESASRVEEVVTRARKEAEDSGAIVSDAVDAMSRIRKSSSEISQIIGVIDDIAFQTNLLSLNAGVEAARAGDAGRGFAVVASEVRALAQRSSEAAKQIKILITSSSEQVETGVGLVGRTGDALGSIIDRVGDIDSLVSGIASGSRAQSVGIGEINLGMSQLDQVTQQNAAMVEEATAAAATLRLEAAGLTRVVSRFRLPGGPTIPSEIGKVIERPPTVTAAPPAMFLEPAVFTPQRAVNSDGWADF